MLSEGRAIDSLIVWMLDVKEKEEVLRDGVVINWDIETVTKPS